MDLLHVINRLRSDTKIAQNGCDRDTPCDKLYFHTIVPNPEIAHFSRKKYIAQVLFAEMGHFGIGDYNVKCNLSQEVSLSHPFWPILRPLP